MSEFKVGDVVENISDGDLDINVGERYTITGVYGSLIDFNDSAGHGRTRTSNGYKLHSRPSETPPATITHEGYTYNRGERVRPEWLNDGTWVVTTKDGELIPDVLYQLVEQEDGFYTKGRYGSLGKITVGFINSFRPHEPSDYKWGDWAMYEGKEVFVMDEVSRDPVYGHERVCVSRSSFSRSPARYIYVCPDKLTPTHAP